MVPRGIISGLKVAWETLGITLKVKENFSACNTLEDVYTSIVRLYNSKLPLTKIRHIGLLLKKQSPKVKLVAIKTSHEQKNVQTIIFFEL